MGTRIRMGWLLLLLGAMALFACRRPEAVVPSAPSVTGRPTAVPPTVTAAPTRTPTATPVPVGVVLAPEGADPAQRTAAMDALRALAEAQGWEVTEVKAVEQVPPGAQLVLALPPADGEAIAQRLPAVPVVAFTALADDAPANLFALDMSPYTPERLAFAAGYLAALHAPDYRVGALFLQGGSLERRVTAFVHGMAYFCGLCRPAFPPFEGYPVWATLPPEAERALWLSAAQTLAQDHKVNLVYVEAWPVAQTLAGAESPAGVHFLGVGFNPQNPGSGDVLAGVDWVRGLHVLWEQAIRPGRSAVEVPPFVVVGSTPGRERWAQETLERLWAGAILP